MSNERGLHHMASINVLYKYRINEIYFIREKEVLQLNWTNVVSFKIGKNYDENIRPEYILTLQLDNKTNMWISRYQNDFQVYLDIHKVLTDNNGNQIGPTTQFMRGIFIAFNPTSSSISIDRLQNTNGTINNSSDTNDLSEMMANAPVTIGLIQRDMFNKSMTPANVIVQKDNLQNIVLSMLTRAGFKKVLMSPFQNYNMYSDVIIPPLPLFRAIQYLDNKYGFYKSGAIIFYDYDTVYIIDSSMKHLVFPSGESPYLTLNIFESTKNIVNGHVTGTTKKEIYVANSTTNIVFGEDFHTSVGSTTTVVDPSSGEQSTITYPSKNVNALESSNVVFSSTESAEFIKQRQLENKVKIGFAGYHYDIDTFKPNILTSVYHSNSDIQSRIDGKYRITAVTCELFNQGDNFIGNTAVSYVYSGK